MMMMEDNSTTSNATTNERRRPLMKGLSPVRKRLHFQTPRSNSQSKRSLKRRLQILIGLYFVLCVSLSALLFTWTVAKTVDHTESSSGGFGGTTSFLRNPFRRVTMSRNMLQVSQSQQQQQHAHLQLASQQALQQQRRDDDLSLNVPEHLRIPDDEPVVHIINTRFMQRQPHLIELGLARLELLQTICLPTLRQQTSLNFLWILRTDPDLAQPIRQGLLQMIHNATALTPHFRVVVLESNTSPAGFRRPEELEASQVWTRNLGLYQHFQEAAQSRIVLETRLDADDGLHTYFVEMMQEEAVRYMSNDKKHGNWLVWCMGTHVEWQYGTPWESNNLQLDSTGAITNVTERAHQNNDLILTTDHDYGSLLPGLTRGCITPGLTKGYGRHVAFEDIPEAQHHLLHTRMRPCDDDENAKKRQHCLVIWKRLIPCAIRGRTPTSAGMQFVLGPKHTSYLSPESEAALGLQTVQQLHDKQPMMWNSVTRRFLISKESIARLRVFLTDHLRGIAQDNLEGQCTPGHSCKNSSKVILTELLKEANNNNATTQQ
ncbi:expressed unknown protein [Seminavis robusta]|uniref:Uncharacterized protein n=1 Tax=Seminavis robusta TaxID=568900 RepID=A0A9N8ENY9_9STRA|nr:expressed unknown protein [Seminavis robusta]|eukprot:Sro1312_g261810.1 n/a (545) ;mRNA; r:7123-8986